MFFKEYGWTRDQVLDLYLVELNLYLRLIERRYIREGEALKRARDEVKNKERTHG